MKYIIILLLMTASVLAANKSKIVLLNSNDGKVIHSGFLLGSITGKNIEKAEIKFDNKNYEEISDPVLWKYKLPSGKETWKNNERHLIEIKITYKDRTSIIKNMSIIKGVNRDLNGDGFPDLVMGDHLYDRNRGVAYIYHGEQEGIQTSGKPAEIIPGSNNESYFGKTLVVEDINKDGFADIVISSFGKKKNVKAYIYKGSETVLGRPFINTVLNDQDKAGYFGVTFSIESIEKPGILKLLIKSDNNKSIKKLKVK